jgi:uncharacterized membrane protein YdjX (TVP38/TMEM64 family)
LTARGGPAMAAISPISSPQQQPRSGLAPLTAIKILIALILVLGSAYMLWMHQEWFNNPRQVKAEIVACGIWGPVIYVLLYAVGPSFLVPGAVMTIAGGLAFGALWGAAYSLIGADLGALIAFSAGRFLGHSFVNRIVGVRFEKLMDRIERHGFQIIFYLRLVPVIPYNALNLLAGASPIRFRDYFWASAIGMIPGTILFAFLGDALWHPTSPRFFVAVGLITICFASGEILRRWRLLPGSY